MYSYTFKLQSPWKCSPHHTVYLSRRRTYRWLTDVSLAIRDANENHSEISPHTCQNGQHKQSNKQVLERLWTKGNPSAPLVGLQTGATTMENSMEFPQKTKNGTPFDPAVPLLGLYPKNPKSPIQKNLCTPVFIAGLFAIAKCWTQPKCPSVNE